MKITEYFKAESNAGLVLEFADNYFRNTPNLEKSEIDYFLSQSSKPVFLRALPDELSRNKWSELCFFLIRSYNYKLNDLLNSRVLEIPNQTLFQDMTERNPVIWTYRRISYYLKEIAASFYEIVNPKFFENNKLEVKPKVAIFCDNSVISASCDLACLCYDIFVTPLNVSFSREIISYVLELLDINIVITDNKNRIDNLISIRNSIGRKFEIFVTNSELSEYSEEINFLGEYETKFNVNEIDKILSSREILKINDVCTMMFTSGSTGMPKGLSFTMYNLISKRFARGAALPEIGENEVLLCYLPLYHTFGRYLEMMGSIYWRATYVFAGNASADTILNLFPKIEPSIFISIPLRWNQLYEKSFELMNEVIDSNELNRIFRSVVGSKLKWGLSAAGYLDPRVFIFFSKNGVELSSGFGMTEATGGITMTPPFAYKEGTVGKPLPGVHLRIDQEGVLEIGGHYVARYLETAPPYSSVSFPDEEDFFISTGDVFKCDNDGYYEIVDRVKDIYKNNKGQTISPKNVENKFESVPGIKRTFLVGDGKPYNTLFIIPDKSDDILMSKPQNELNDYYNLLILKVNQELVNYERIVNYVVLDRDFSAEKGELTPKNSYNRKNIEKNFADEIEKLYIKNHLDFNYHKYIIRIPRWFFRDIGVLESDIILTDKGLMNLRNGNILKLESDNNENLVKIGDLIYEVENKIINLGTIIRQPKLWTGNPNLIKFSPVKDGWDTNFDGISENVFIKYDPRSDDYKNLKNHYPAKIPNQLIELNNLFCDTFFGDLEIAEKSLNELEKILENTSERNIDLIRKRIQTLARHPIESIRCTAYRVLLLDEPSPDYSKVFPAFIKSGLSYLNESSIKQIASGKFEIRRLEALRKRLLAYRTLIELPDDEITVSQFRKLFQLLLDFLMNNPEYYTSVRYEFISWMLYDRLPDISKNAAEYFKKMHLFYEKLLDESTLKYPEELWASKIVFDDGMSIKEKSLINSILINKAFLKQSVILCFDENDFSINDVKDEGAWISRLNSGSAIMHYRIVIAMKNQRRYDLQFFINVDSDEQNILQTILRHVAISGYPYGYRVLAKLGAYRQELRAWSFEYFGELSLWAKIREFSSQRISGYEFNKKDSLRKYYIQAISAFFTGWRNSGKKILPGIISPNNVIIPELDFRDGVIINSINGWTMYENSIQFIETIIRNFYSKVTLHYPWLEPIIEKGWIFDAVIDSLDLEEGTKLLKEILSEFNSLATNVEILSLTDTLQLFIDRIESRYYPQIKISSAIERYNDWLNDNIEATNEAKEHTIRELISLYNINLKNEPDRFYIYLRTYFKNSGSEITNKFMEIINRLYRNKTEKATQLIELSELQSLIDDMDSRFVFTRMLFPKGSSPEMKIIRQGNDSIGKTIISSYIKDNNGEIYTLRETVNVAEIGNLFRLFFKEKYPKVISELDEFFVLTDSLDRIVGGISYKKIDKNSVLIDGGIVIKSLSNRGIGTAMLEDFCSRMASLGFETVKAHFFLKNFYLKRGFIFDKRHGTLVRFLNSPSSTIIMGNYCLI